MSALTIDASNAQVLVTKRDVRVLRRRRVPLGAIAEEDPELDALYRCWAEARRRLDRMPARGSIDPLSVPGLRRTLHLIGVDPGERPQDVRFVPLATGAPIGRKRDLGSICAGTAPGGGHDIPLTDAYRAVVWTGAPCYEHVGVRVGDVRHQLASLILPLSSDGRRVGTLLVSLRRLVPAAA